MNPIILHLFGNKYDLTEYVDYHPGGSSILTENVDKDVTELFINQGHSAKAKKLLDKYYIGKSHYKSENIDYNESNKLFTHEDPYNIHKILGLYCLLHYVYRFFIFFKNYDVDFEASFTNDYVSLVSIIPHILLSLSSFIFKVPRERIKGAPMIWQEFRLHNLIFSLRSCISFMITYFVPENISVYLKIANIFTTLLLADIITKYVGNKNQSTTRVMPYWDNVSPITENLFKKYYMLAQIEATIGTMGSYFATFNVIFPIQFSSLLMTLVRKNYIGAKMWHILYLSSLLTCQIISFRYGSFALKIVLLGIFMTFIKLKTNISKYTLWTGFSLLYFLFYRN
jgi:hypothetical protein